MLCWLRIIFLGLAKLPLRLIAPLAYPFIDPVHNPVFGVRDATDTSFYNIAIRNACHNLTRRPGVPYRGLTNTDDWTLEKYSGLQWRWRQSLDGRYASFRVTWGEPRPKGKREFYVGWTLGQHDLKGNYVMRLTFFQLRPF